MTSTTTRIVLVDDHPIVRSGIATLFSLNDDLEVVGKPDRSPKEKKSLRCKIRISPFLIFGFLMALGLMLHGGSLSTTAQRAA